MISRRRYVQVGLGGRSYMYHQALLGKYADYGEMSGVCDTNEGRVQLHVNMAEAMGVKVAGYSATQFDQMVRECRPDIVIVTTKDKHHDEYICRAMELGCDVITEKPMTTTAEKCQRILDTIHATGRNCRVTFNYRYSPPRTQIKHVLMSGVIGEVLSVDFHWLLDTSHGADYFRRWHRNKINSGGLLVHKATHHFDLVNWWLATVPVKVYANGQRRFYVPQQAQAYGLFNRSERCLNCQEAPHCRFYLDLTRYSDLKMLYLDNEQYDGYFRDQCVFSDRIDIEDSISMVVEYQNGVKMSYSLNAFTPWEGYTIAFNGTRGRLEHRVQETVYISGDGSVPGASIPDGVSIRIFPHFASPDEIEVWQAEGGHGGGDELLLEDLFSPHRSKDPYLRAADHRSGAYSILTGIAANRSIETRSVVEINNLVHGLEMPDYPERNVE